MAARSTEHQELKPGPSRHLDISPGNEDGAADENINREIAMEVNLNRYRRLYRAALHGKWKKASKFFDDDPNAFTAKIAVFSMTALHVAASEGKVEFVEKMLLDKRLPKEVLKMPDEGGLTPLHYAAEAGSIRMAKALLTKDKSLTQILDYKDYTPLLTAARKCSNAQEPNELLWYLARKTKDDPPASPFTGKMAGQLISCLAYAGFYEIIQCLLGLYPNLITAVNSDHANILLRAMAEEPSNFESGHTFNIWERWIYQIVPVEPIDTMSCSLKGDIEEPSQNSKSHAKTPVWRTYGPRVLRWLKMSPWAVIEKSVPFIMRIRNTKSRHKVAMDLVKTLCEQVSKKSNVEMLQYFNDHDILVTAVTNGVVEIVRVCLKFLPDLIWLPVKDQTLVFHAVKHRQEKIFNLLCESTALRNQKAYNNIQETGDNSVLIQAAKLSPQARLTSVSGAALQMQREMQWFKAVESMLNPSFRREKFKGKTAWQMFQEEHKDLLKEGQEWMKNTSNYCVIVAILIATVVFAAAFTVPGGSDQGIPIFLKTTSFTIFTVSDAVALFYSITSILIFLSLHTSRYAEEDFLVALPRRLIIGLFYLFVAIAAMVCAFGATLYIMVGETWKWGILLIVLLALVPAAISFVKLQVGLFIQLYQSTYGKHIFRPQMPW